MKWRLKLQNAIESLPLKHQESFTEDIKALYVIDPFRRRMFVLILLITSFVLKWYTVAVIITVSYVVWVLIYLLVFYGVYLMFKQKKSEYPTLKRLK